MRSAVLLVAILLCASAGAAPRAGKVVRVERRAAGYSGHPRFCSVHAADMYGQCVGAKGPEVGDRMTVINHQRVLGVVRVTQVQPYNDGCSQTYQWMIRTTLDSGDLSGARGTVIAVSDVPLDVRTAKVVNVDTSPTGNASGTDTIYAIDGNADNKADVEFIQYPCDDAGNASLTSPTGTCFEVWASQNGRTLERLRRDHFRACQ